MAAPRAVRLLHTLQISVSSEAFTSTGSVLSLACLTYFHVRAARGARREENTYGECRQVFVSLAGMLNNQMALNTLVEMSDLPELAMATHNREAVQEAISRATLQLGDTELRPRQDLVCFPTVPSLASCWRGSRPPPSVVQVLVSSLAV